MLLITHMNASLPTYFLILFLNHPNASSHLTKPGVFCSRLYTSDITVNMVLMSLVLLLINYNKRY